VSPQSLQCAVGSLASLGKHPVAVFPSLEAVQLVRLKSGALEHRLVPADAKRSPTCEVTSLLLCSAMPTRGEVSAASLSATQQGYYIVAGYANGYVSMFSSDASVLSGAPSCRWYALGHKPDTNVLSLAVSTDRTLVASGAQDTDITLWDVSCQEPAFRLKGHRGGVVGLRFVPNHDDALISGAADGWIKVWNLDVRQCVQTIVASDAQVTSMCLDVTGQRLYVGLREDVIRVYCVADAAAAAAALSPSNEAMLETLLTDHGSISRKSNKAVTGMQISDDGYSLIAWTGRTLEVFRSYSAEDVRKKLQRKRKRRRTEGGDAELRPDSDDEERYPNQSGDVQAAPAQLVTATASEEWRHLRTFFLDDKLRSAAFVPPTTATEKDQIHILVTYNNNTAISYVTSLVESQLEGASMLTLSDLIPRSQLTEHGHHTDVRYVTFVDEDSALLSLGKEGVRLWSVTGGNTMSAENDDALDDDTFFARKEANLSVGRALKCTGSIDIEDATSMATSGTSDLCCVGTESGAVHLVNVVASEIIATQSVHIGAVKAVACRPDHSGFTSIGVDRRLVVWTLAIMNDKAKTVTLQLTHEMELNESPLFIEYSPDGKLVGVGLQDNNIQLFYADTMKPFLALFGHKLPPTSLSFSSDGTLAASVGMDKSLRFWGTDFGDCHRAIHAHDEYVTSVQFVPDTHYVFTCSMDGTVKYWDGDTWTMIQRFRFHQRGVWGLAVNSNGSCFASSGVDRMIRLGCRTEEILFPQEEEERMAQEAMDEDAARRLALQKLEDKNAEVAQAGQATASTADAAEALMEALDVISVELQRKEAEGPAYQPHVLFRTKSEWEHLWSVLESIRPSELNHALGALTSTHVVATLEFLEKALEHGAVTNYETAAKVVLGLVTPPPGKSQAKAFLSVNGEGSDTSRCIQRLRVLIATGLQRTADRMDFNMAGLRFLMQQATQQDRVRFFDLTKIQGHKKKYSSSAAHKQY